MYPPTQALNPAGDLSIEVITAYNFVVDSNVLSPSTYAPRAGTIGAPQYGVHIVAQDTIPTGTQYVSGTAAAGNTLGGSPYIYDVLYSTNGGTTWTSTEPVPASSVTNIQWWMPDALAYNQTGVVTFSVVVPATYPASVVENTAGMSFGNNPPFAEDTSDNAKIFTVVQLPKTGETPCVYRCKGFYEDLLPLSHFICTFIKKRRKTPSFSYGDIRRGVYVAKFCIGNCRTKFSHATLFCAIVYIQWGITVHCLSQRKPLQIARLLALTTEAPAFRHGEYVTYFIGFYHATYTSRWHSRIL